MHYMIAVSLEMSDEPKNIEKIRKIFNLISLT